MADPNRFFRWREMLAFAADVFGVKEGLSGLFVVFPAVWASLSAYLGFIEGIPWYWVVTLTPISGALFLFLLVALSRLWQPLPLRNPEQWRGHHAYRAWIAACLWVELNPHEHIPPISPAYAPLQRIKSALMAGHIDSLNADSGMKADISRDALINLARESPGPMPKFLQ